MSKRQHVFSVRELGERHAVSSIFGKDVLGDRIAAPQAI